MIKLKYVLIARDDQDKKLMSVSTGCELFRGVRNRCVAPAFHRYLQSIFRMHPTVTRIEVMDLAGWVPGVDVESLNWLLTASKTEETRALSERALVFSFPDAVESVVAP